MADQFLFKHFSDILNEMIDNYDFFKFYFQGPYCIEESEIPNIGRLSCGISRGCIVDDTSDYVLKFDLCDTYDESATCEREEEIYREACSRGFGKYFTNVKFLGIFRKTVNYFSYLDCFNLDMNYFDEDEWQNRLEALDGYGVQEIEITVPLYVYEKVWRFGLNHCYNSDEIERAKSLYKKSPMTSRNASVAAAFIEAYGEREYIEFSDFCKMYRINDLHSHNIGYIQNNLVISDFCGYEYESYYEDEYYE